MELNGLPIPDGWFLVGSGVLAENKNNPSAKYYGELYDTPNGFINIITQYDLVDGDLVFNSVKHHLLKPDSTVLYKDEAVSYVLHGDPDAAIRRHINAR